jgi:hypothetical protein
MNVTLNRGGKVHEARDLRGDECWTPICGVQQGPRSRWRTTARPVTCETCLARNDREVRAPEHAPRASDPEAIAARLDGAWRVFGPDGRIPTSEVCGATSPTKATVALHPDDPHKCFARPHRGEWHRCPCGLHFKDAR